MAELKIKAIGMAAALSVIAENKHVQKAYVHCVAEYAAKIDEVCEKIEQSSAQIQIAEADFLTSVTKSIQVSYMCRKKDCGFYGMNDQWVKHETTYHFRCPHCATRYTPWKEQPKFYKFQKVISVSHPATGERWVMPALWPASEADDFLQKMMVVTASNMQTVADVEAFVQGNIQALDAMLANAGQPAIFKRFTLSQEVTAMLQTCAGYGSKQFAELEEHGYYGNILDPNLGAQEPFSEWNEFIAVFGSLLGAGEQVAHKLKV